MPTNKIKQTISYIAINTTEFIELSIMKRVGYRKVRDRFKKFCGCYEPRTTKYGHKNILNILQYIFPQNYSWKNILQYLIPENKYKYKYIAIYCNIFFMEYILPQPCLEYVYLHRECKYVSN